MRPIAVGGAGWLCDAWLVSTDGGSASGRQAAGPVVIGAEMAAARAAETRHHAAPHGPSPLVGVAYQGELSLLRFTAAAADEFIDGFVDLFAASGREDRAHQRSTLTMDDFYTLLTYARRAVVRALRSHDDRVARRGLVALAVVDYDRVDWRDLAWQAGLLSYAIGTISGDVSGPFRAAAALGEGETAALLTRMARETVASLSQWRFREIRTAAGIGLIEDEGKPYQPASDLLAVAAAVAGAMRGDRWRLSDPVTGAGLPAVWLGAGDPEHVEPAIGSITGCVTLRGAMATQEPPSGRSQHMLIFLAETGDPSAARVIAQAAGPRSGSWFAAVSAAVGTLCAVMITRSVVQGIPPVETQASLERFGRVLADALVIGAGQDKT